MNVKISVVGNLAGKYLIFKLQAESYGICESKVREIIWHTSVTAMPQMPEHICGVFNLRGKMIPVMDLRKRFGLITKEDTDQNCILVIQVQLADQRATPMGLVVDGIEGTVSISPIEMEKPCSFGGRISGDYVVGVTRVKGSVTTLLDIDNVVDAEAMKEAPFNN